MKDNRLEELTNHLYVKQKISLKEAMEIFSVSESTARRMFIELQNEGLAIRTHGGIQCNNMTFSSYSFERKEQTNSDKKIKIAKKACEIIEDGDIIFCDSGTTIRCFCSHLTLYLLDKKLNVKFCTNSLANLNILSPHFPVTLIGGEYRANRKDFCGYIAEHSLEKLYFTKCFLGTDGFVEPSMFTTTDYNTAKIAELAIKHSKNAYLLTDSSKFSKASHITYVDTHELCAIITDAKLPEKTETGIKEQGCNLIYA